MMIDVCETGTEPRRWITMDFVRGFWGSLAAVLVVDALAGVVGREEGGWGAWWEEDGEWRVCDSSRILESVFIASGVYA